MIQELRNKGYFNLRQVANWARSTTWHQQWLSWEEIGLGAEYVEEWKRYTDLLIVNNVRLKEEEDQLIWSLNPTGAYVPK
jgi:hypothetical protein